MVTRQAQSDGFHKSPNILIFDYLSTGKISVNAYAVYSALLTFHNPARDNDVWPSRQTIAQMVNVKNVESVTRRLNELRDAGLILITPRRNGKQGQMSNKYTLLLTAGAGGGIEVQGEIEVQGGDGSKSTGGVDLDTPELEELELEEVELEEPKNLSSERLASLDAPDVSEGAEEPESATTEERDSYFEDRNLFIGVVGEEVLYDDKAAFFDDADNIHSVYHRLREGSGEAAPTPGNFVQEIHSAGGDDAVSAWLASQGLNRPIWMEPGDLAE